MFYLSEKSWKNLEGVDPRLVAVVAMALTKSGIDFGVSEGLRSYKRQRMMVQQGKSQTLKSKHLYGEAVDLYAWVNGNVSWDLVWYREINVYMLESAATLDVAIRWGNDWDRDGVEVGQDPDERFVDGVHWELVD